MALVPSDDPNKVRVALALSESARRIERTEAWELYTEALARADRAEQRAASMHQVMIATRKERAEVRRLKQEAAKKLVELEQAAAEQAAQAAERLRMSPGEVLAETLNAERAGWGRKKAVYQEIMRTFTAEQLWQRAKAGTDVY